ncbi:hypothetical protein [Fusobacterium sp. PH5-44]|uniref:hypothetical protein n=1 Tax=unclassified Fusobacterium TaxID=2648384 RepID=UPI003D25BED3
MEVEVKFYGKDDIKEIKDLTTLAKLDAQGFAVASDGSIWVNTEVLMNNNTLNFNKLFAHEIGHLMGGNETVANYMEKSYGEFVGGIGSSGYVDIGGSIRDWGKNPLSGDDANRLLGYKADEIEFKGYILTDAQIKALESYITNSTELEEGVFTKKELNVLRNKKIAGITDGNLKVWKDGKVHVIEIGSKNEDGTTNVNFSVAGLSEKQSDNYTDAVIKVIENDAAKIVVLVTTEFDTWMNYNPNDEIYPGAYFSTRYGTIISEGTVTEIERALQKSDRLKLDIGNDIIIGIISMGFGPLLSKGGKVVKWGLTTLGTISAGVNGKASYDSYQNGDKDYAIYYGIKSGVSITAVATTLSSNFQGSNGKEIGNVKITTTESQIKDVEFLLKANPDTIYVNPNGVAAKGSDLNAAGQLILNSLVNNPNTVPEKQIGDVGGSRQQSSGGIETSLNRPANTINANVANYQLSNTYNSKFSSIVGANAEQIAIINLVKSGEIVLANNTMKSNFGQISSNVLYEGEGYNGNRYELISHRILDLNEPKVKGIDNVYKAVDPKTVPRYIIDEDKFGRNATLSKLVTGETQNSYEWLKLKEYSRLTNAVGEKEGKIIINEFAKANPSVQFNLTHIKNITNEPKIIQLDYNGKKINIKR